MTASKRRKNADSAGSQIQAYLAAQPPRARATLRKLRATIRTAAPEAIECFSYRMPGFKLDGKALIWYAGFKEHTSLFPITGRIQHAMADRLKGLQRSTGTVRFPLDKPVAVALVRQLVKARIAEVHGKGKR